MRALHPTTKITAALLLQSAASGVMAWQALLTSIWRGDYGWVHEVNVLLYWTVYEIPIFACLALAVTFAVCALGIRRDWRRVRTVIIATEVVAIPFGAIRLIVDVTLDSKAVAVFALVLAVSVIVFLRGGRSINPQETMP